MTSVITAINLLVTIRYLPSLQAGGSSQSGGDSRHLQSCSVRNITAFNKKTIVIYLVTSSSHHMMPSDSWSGLWREGNLYFKRENTESPRHPPGRTLCWRLSHQHWFTSRDYSTITHHTEFYQQIQRVFFLEGHLFIYNIYILVITAHSFKYAMTTPPPQLSLMSHVTLI